MQEIASTKCIAMSNSKSVDPEITQANLRLLLSSLSFIVIAFEIAYMHNPLHDLLFLNTAHLLYSIYMRHIVIRDQGDYHWRKVLHVLVDIGVISGAFYFSTVYQVFLYPFYFWIIIGNGIRYGIHYLYLGLFVAVGTFGLATMYNPSWHAYEALGKSLTISLIALTLFFTMLISRIHYLNKTLHTRIEDRTKELEHNLLHDQLTSLKNRKALMEDLRNYPFRGIMMMDIDKFGHYNDLYGMKTGNKILKEISEHLIAFAKRHDYDVYRTYGDGFVLRANTYHDEQDIDAILPEISTFSVYLESLDEHIEISTTTVFVDDSKNVLEKADRALKFARLSGVCYATYNENMNNQEDIKNTLYWKKEIHAAIKEDRIVPVFQPIVDHRANIVKYEALIRLKQIQSNENKLVSPIFFLDIAIQTNQYEKLAMIMIEKSFQAARKLQADFSINLTYGDLRNEKISEFLEHMLQTYPVGKHLILEIVESEEVKDFAIVKEFVQHFRTLGVRFAIDDFGSGFLNYEHILEIMPDFLKIDGSLIKNIDLDDKAYKLSKSIVHLSQSLGIKTVAEYVHNQAVFQVVKNLNIDEFQGYYFSPPLTFEEIYDFKVAAAS